MRNRSNKKLVANKTKKNPMRLDPARTLSLRAGVTRTIQRQFSALRLAIADLVVKEDALGLKEDAPLFNVFCATGTGGGVDPSCSPSSGVPTLEVVSRTKELMQKSLNNPSLSREQKLAYGGAVIRVLSSMPRGVFESALKGVKEIRFHPDLNSLNQDPAVTGSKINNLPNGGKIAGGYKASQSLALLDGAVNIPNVYSPHTTPDNSGLTGAYSRELGHAIDYHHSPQGPLSGTSGWKEAHEELRTSLSKTASVSPRESFAEFSRLLYGSPNSDKKKAETLFPKAFQFFRSQGLWS